MRESLAVDDVVEISSLGAIRVVTLNRPEALNAANRDLHNALANVWDSLAADREKRAVVITGAGRAFCAGGDLDLLEDMRREKTVRRSVIDEAAHLVRGMLAVDVPVLAAVNGPAVGLGFSLASLSDIVVMADSAYFSDPHVALGLVAADGGALTLPLLVSLQRAKEFVLLGERISAQEALRLGLANRVVAKDKVLSTTIDLAQRLAAMPPQAVAETKKILNARLLRGTEIDLAGALEAEYESFDTPEFASNLSALRSRSAG